MDGLGLEVLRVRGRADREVEVEIVRPLTVADLDALDDEKGSLPAPLLKRLSERHHAAARMLASGMQPYEICARTGYAPSSLSILQGDPTFKELVHFYRDKVEDQFRDMHERLAGLSADALNELRDRLETDPSKIGLVALMDMVKMGADRTGYGPSSTNIQVNVGLAQRLEAARKRVSMIDVTPQKEDAA